MDPEFADDDLDRLETDAKFTGGYAQAVVRGFRKALQAIRSATDLRDLYSTRGFRMERLQGKRQHQHSMRINGQWRLIIEVIEKGPTKKIKIVRIEDYH
jgi:proteic killer suppression protein